MTAILELIFWTASALVFYIYIGYPLLVALLARASKNIQRASTYQPFVSVLIPAHNEADAIEATLLDKLAQNYPADRFEIIVVSDQSDDGTDAIVRTVATRSDVPVRLHRQSPRRGKTAGINTLAAMARGEILAFADANSLWAPDALAALVSNFADGSVGYVTGKMVYTHADGSLVGDGCSAYMRYENWVRARETEMGSVVGVDGGVDAMRRRLYTPLRADQLPDFVQPLKVIEQGYRVVYEPDALLKEATLADSQGEFSMRVRVTLRALWALKDMAHLMNPLRDARFALQLISHKLLRYFAFVPLFVAAATALLLIDVHWIYAVAAIAQATFYALGVIGMCLEGRFRLPLGVFVPYYFLLLNLSCVYATVGFARGERRATWTPRKG